MSHGGMVNRGSSGSTWRAEGHGDEEEGVTEERSLEGRENRIENSVIYSGNRV